MRIPIRIALVSLVVALVAFANVIGSADSTDQAPPKPPEVRTVLTSPPADFVIGTDDILTITVFGQDPKYSGDVTVRPDGKVAMLLIGDTVATGLTLVQLKAELTKAYSKFFEGPTILIAAKQINSRKVAISGLVAKPGEYRLTDPMDVVQLIARAGGLRAGADKESIEIIRRHADGKTETILFNVMKLFEDRVVTKIPELRPGDQVVVK